MALRESLGSRPNFSMRPATWAPTSMTSSGSVVPVALMMASRSPRSTAAVRKVFRGPCWLCQYHTPKPPPAARTSTRSAVRTSFIVISSVAPNSFSPGRVRQKPGFLEKPGLPAAASALAGRLLLQQPVQVALQPVQQAVQLGLLRPAQAAQHPRHLPVVDLQDPPDQLAPGRRQPHRLGPQIVGRAAALQQAGPLQPVHHAGDA